MMEFQLRIIGILLIVLSLVHFAFPKYFNWKQELGPLSAINRQLMVVHTFFIALAVFFIGLLCLTSASDLVNTVLGKRISCGLAIFWAARLYVQFFGFSSETWKGKSFETAVHVAISVFWTYLSVFFVAVYLV